MVAGRGGAMSLAGRLQRSGTQAAFSELPSHPVTRTTYVLKRLRIGT